MITSGCGGATTDAEAGAESPESTRSLKVNVGERAPFEVYVRVDDATCNRAVSGAIVVRDASGEIVAAEDLPLAGTWEDTYVELCWTETVRFQVPADSVAYTVEIETENGLRGRQVVTPEPRGNLLPVNFSL
jgi:hypothetical protein